MGEITGSTRHHWADIFIVRGLRPDGRKGSTTNSTATCSTWRGMGSVGFTLPFSHREMTTNNQTVPDRLPPGLTRTAPSAVHQDGGIKQATGTPSESRGRDNINTGTWNTRTLGTVGKLWELTHELDGYRWKILGLYEMRWKNFDETTEGGHKVVFSRREHCRGMSPSLQQAHHHLPESSPFHRSTSVRQTMMTMK